VPAAGEGAGHPRSADDPRWYGAVAQHRSGRLVGDDSVEPAVIDLVARPPAMGGPVLNGPRDGAPSRTRRTCALTSSTRVRRIDGQQPHGLSARRRQDGASAVTRPAETRVQSRGARRDAGPTGIAAPRSSGIVAAVTAFPSVFSLTLGTSRDVASCARHETLDEQWCSPPTMHGHPRCVLRCGSRRSRDALRHD